MSRYTTGLRGRGDVNRARDLDGAGLRGRGDVIRTQDLDDTGDSITNVLRSRSRAFAESESRFCWSTSRSSPTVWARPPGECNELELNLFGLPPSPGRATRAVPPGICGLQPLRVGLSLCDASSRPDLALKQVLQASVMFCPVGRINHTQDLETCDVNHTQDLDGAASMQRMCVTRHTWFER